MKCNKCGGKLRVVDSISTDHRTYRRLKCEVCSNVRYSYETLASPEDEIKVRNRLCKLRNDKAAKGKVKQP